MKKVRIKPTEAETSLRPVIRNYKDEVQKMVEIYFAQGLEAHEIAEKLGILDAREINKRYIQVQRQYLAAAEQLTVESAKIEVLRILKRSLLRREDIADEVSRRQRRLKQGLDEDFPNKEIANLREEDRFIYKIMMDFDKTSRPRKDLSDRAVDEINRSNNVEETRSLFNKMVVDFQPTDYRKVLSEDLEADLQASMEETEF
jgi:transposase-like protein